MTVKELIELLRTFDGSLSVLAFDANTGEYSTIKVYEETISRDSSWARYSQNFVVIEAED